ncbi:uncharacterized protein LOC132195312 [Neocloeon triangulifer]|uniref:uncharacterized protein LOC132195312 n=1 Tax=Neocloeon triangulifer TaxID=2078957 RepID=UPI00286F442E|nr:uncharacterized protein LOC132195312 [Neocloeon triangulifer]XP_059473215.1 uncharacterized protein LOC132195312 [Neocloeon triangulifer]
MAPVLTEMDGGSEGVAQVAKETETGGVTAPVLTEMDGGSEGVAQMQTQPIKGVFLFVSFLLMTVTRFFMRSIMKMIEHLRAKAATQQVTAKEDMAHGVDKRDLAGKEGQDIKKG